MSANTVTAVAAVIVAVIALVVSVADKRRAQKHDRLSVRPLLRIDRCARDGEDVSLILRNGGLGPAVIRAIGVGYRAGPVFPALQEDMHAPWHAALEHRGTLLKGYVTFLPSRGDALAHNETLELLKFPGSGNNSAARLEALAFIQEGLSVEVKYESIYGEEFRVKGKPSGTEDDEPAS